MKKFRKKPVVIEAIKFTGINFYIMPAYIGEEVLLEYNAKTLVIKTLEGNHTARVGDWIIKGVKGEFYPCKPDIFEMTYEKVDQYN